MACNSPGINLIEFNRIQNPETYNQLIVNGNVRTSNKSLQKAKYLRLRNVGFADASLHRLPPPKAKKVSFSISFSGVIKDYLLLFLMYVQTNIFSVQEGVIFNACQLDSHGRYFVNQLLPILKKPAFYFSPFKYLCALKPECATAYDSRVYIAVNLYILF